MPDVDGLQIQFDFPRFPNMFLDSATLQDLEIVPMSSRGGTGDMTKYQLRMLVISALGLFALPRTADACDCVGGRVLPPAQFSPSDIVFLGRVVRSQPLVSVEMEVLETF